MTKYMKLLVVVFFFTIPSFSKGQIIISDTFNIRALWEKGDVYKYKVETYKSQIKDEGNKQSTSIQYVNFEILNKTSKSYTIKYSIDSMVMDEKFKENPAINSYMKEFFSKIVYEIKTDEYGGYVELTNWKKLRTNLMEIYGNLEAVKELTKDQRSNVLKTMELALDSRYKVEFASLKKFGELFSNYGQIFNIKNTTHYNSSVASPYGNEPILIKGSINFDLGSNSNSNIITLHEKIIFDSLTSKIAISEAIKEIFPNTKIEDLDTIKMNIEDEFVQQYSLKNGSIEKSEYERKVTLTNSNIIYIGTERRTHELINLFEKK